MIVTVGELHDAFRDAYDRKSDVATIGDEPVPMYLLDALLRHIERHIAPVAEEKGFDIETMRMDTRDMPVCMCAAAITDEEVNMAQKDFGNATYCDLKTAYKKAVDEQAETFSVGTVEFYTKYAKYLIEYLDGRKIPDEVLLRDIMTPAKED